MPKQVANIINFSGGLNNKTNPRDLEVNQFQILDSLSIETPGKLKVMGSFIHDDKLNVGLTGAALNHGNGLLYLKTDKDLGSNAEESSESFLINDTTTKTVKIFDYTDDAYESGEVISLAKVGGTAQASQVNYLSVDGNVLLSPHSSFNINNVPKWYGHIDRKYNLGVQTDGTNLNNIKHNYDGYYVDDMFLAPVRGREAASGDLHDYDFSKDITFHPSRYTEELKSEIVLNPGTPTIGLNTSGAEAVGAINVTYANVRNELDNHPEYSSHFGTMRMYAWFDQQTTNANVGDSEIVVYKSSINTSGIYKYHELYASIVYEDGESFPVHIGTILQPTLSGDYKRSLYFSFIGRLPNNPRQKGIKVYYAESELDINIDTNYGFSKKRHGVKFLFCELDFEKGIRMGGTSNYVPFFIPTVHGGGTINNDSSASTEFNYVYPNNYVYGPYDKLNGSRVNTLQRMKTEPWIVKKQNIIGKPGTGWKTSTTVNRKSYIGNVSYSNETNSGLIESPDTVFKSYVNEFGYFEIDRRLEVEINDGDGIVKLSSLGGKLFEFKTKKLFIINLTRDIEYLEADLMYKGVNKDYHVLDGDNFIAWFNQYGVFLYDGEQIRELLIDQKGQERLLDWQNNYYHDDAVIGYEPHSKSIIITNKTNQSVLSFDMKSLSWTIGSKKCLTDNSSNFVNNANGELIHYSQLISGTTNTGITIQFDITTSSSKIAIIGNSNPWTIGTVLLLDNEKVTVTSGSSYGAGLAFIAVTRASAGTTAAAHTGGVTVIHKVSAAGISIYKWNNNPSKLLGTNEIDDMALKTKDFTFGEPSIDKKIVSVYISYKNGNGVTLYGYSDAVEEKLADLDGSLETNYKTLHIKIKDINDSFVTTNAFKAVKSFGIRLDGNNIETDFEINDMQIVYRPKALK